jgi:hypothetical protein
VTDAKIFVEGGGNDNHALTIRCREGFRKLLENGGLTGRLPRIIPCGSRNEAYDSFTTEHLAGKTSYVALLVDSEVPVINGEKPWEHLKNRAGDNWECPAGATDDQVFLMTTCMETWIVADKEGLKRFFEKNKSCLRPTGLPSTINLEAKDSHIVQDALITATKDCSNAYAKNKRSFEALANISPGVLRGLLPAFARMERILHAKL